MRKLLLFLLFLTAACAVAPTGPPTTPNDREWTLLMADYQWIQTLRQAQKQPAATASRKEQIEIILENHKKIEPPYVAFVDKAIEYFERTADPRAGQLLALLPCAPGAHARPRDIRAQVGHLQARRRRIVHEARCGGRNERRDGRPGRRGEPRQLGGRLALHDEQLRGDQPRERRWRARSACRRAR